MDLQMWFLKKLGIDKVLHFLSGGWFACFASFLESKVGIIENYWWAIILACAIGLLKELIDKYIRKSFIDIWDWIFTILGGITTSIFIYFGLM